MGAIGFLNVGYVNGLERTNMLIAIQCFYQQYHQCCVDYEGHTSYILQKKLTNDKLDIIMTHRLINDADYINEKIFQSQIMVFVARDTELANKNYFEQNELSSLNLITNTTDMINENITPKTIDQLLLQVLKGQEATILPDYAIQYTQFQNYLIGIPVKGMYENIYAVYKKENHNPLIYKFIEILKNNF